MDKGGTSWVKWVKNVAVGRWRLESRDWRMKREARRSGLPAGQGCVKREARRFGLLAGQGCVKREARRSGLPAGQGCVKRESRRSGLPAGHLVGGEEGQMRFATARAAGRIHVLCAVANRTYRLGSHRDKCGLLPHEQPEGCMVFVRFKTAPTGWEASGVNAVCYRTKG